MNHLEVRHLKLVTAIADQGSVTSAANHLNLTQSALSHQLRDIEERLGASLFHRRSRRMFLTPAGERLLESARNVLAELRRIEEDIIGRSQQLEGVLRVSTECYTCYHWLPSRLKLFSERYSRVEVRFVLEATRRPFQALLENKLDLAIASTRVRNRRLIYKPLFKDELMVIMRPDHPLASRSFIVAEDFVAEHLITYNAPKEDLTIFQEVLVPAGVIPRQHSQVELTEGVLEMAKAGLGISVMAKWAAAPYLDSGALKALRLTRGGFRRTWFAVMLRDKSAPAYMGEFVKILASRPTPDREVICKV
ncbi:MAG TPA: LysR substrate-binding domain-containing protein [Terriglobia bacterium]|nr:LysR substrate-binding domain-containing protein [Terriglobia bacterium]